MEALFSDQVRDIIQTSGKLAVRFRYDYIGPEHVLLAIIDESLKNKNVVLDILKGLNVNLFNLIEDIEASFDNSKSSAAKSSLPLTKASEKILKLSYLEAMRFHSIFIETEHLLLSYLKHDSAFCERVLTVKYGLTYEKAKTWMEAGG